MFQKYRSRLYIYNISRYILFTTTTVSLSRPPPSPPPPPPTTHTHTHTHYRNRMRNFNLLGWLRPISITLLVIQMTRPVAKPGNTEGNETPQKKEARVRGEREDVKHSYTCMTQSYCRSISAIPGNTRKGKCVDFIHFAVISLDLSCTCQNTLRLFIDNVHAYGQILPYWI